MSIHFENDGKHTKEQQIKAAEEFGEKYREADGKLEGMGDINGVQDVIEDIPMTTADDNYKRDMVHDEYLKAQEEQERILEIAQGKKPLDKEVVDPNDEAALWDNGKFDFDEYHRQNKEDIEKAQAEMTERFNSSGLTEKLKNSLKYDGINKQIEDLKRDIDLGITSQMFNENQELANIKITDANRQDIINQREKYFQDFINEKMDQLKALEDFKELYGANYDMEGKEYVVRGAIIQCSCGSHMRRLNLPKCHGVYLKDKPMMNDKDSIVGDFMNIPTFGICSSNLCPQSEIRIKRDVKREEGTYYPIENQEDVTENINGRACYPEIMTNWLGVAEKTIIENGCALTLNSFLVCKNGGIIEIMNSGQDDPQAVVSPGDKRIQEGHYIRNGI